MMTTGRRSRLDGHDNKTPGREKGGVSVNSVVRIFKTKNEFLI